MGLPELARAQDASAAVAPPEVLERVDALLPEGALESGQRAEVSLAVTVELDGSVGAIDVVRSGGPRLDAAASAALRRWRFTPAMRAGEPIASRIQVSIGFAAPAAPAPPPSAASPASGASAQGSGGPSSTGPSSAAPSSTASPSAAAGLAPGSGATSFAPAGAPAGESSGGAGSGPSAAAAAGARDMDEGAIDVTVLGERELRAQQRSVSDFRIERELLRASPRQEGAEVLRSAPGVYVGRGEGAAVAHSYMLRGFDAEHGQDIEFRVGGLPINMPSHLHGQGYADLGFLIGETVRELHVSEGVYDPRQGDFAVAGAIDIDLGVDPQERGLRVRSSYGSFGTFRQLLLWAPPDAERETFGAAEYKTSDGFGQNRAGQAGNAVFQLRLGEGTFRYRVLGIVHGARADLAGVVRADDVASGRVCFECVYAYPSARAQNALAERGLLGFFVDYAGSRGDNGQLAAWIGYDVFRLQENFTGFIQSSQTLERTAGRGDLIEQQNRTSSLGLSGRYRSAAYAPADGFKGHIELGANGRLDGIDQAQNLLDAAVRNQTWDKRVDAAVRGMDLGLWGDLDWSLTRHVNVRAGLRADALSYDVDDRLGNFAPLIRPKDTYIVGYRRSAFGVVWGPRTSLEIKPWSFMAIRAAYGEGYRSPQARILDDGERAPFTKVRSADAGLRFDFGAPLQFTVGGYFTRLSDDVAFDAAQGRLERIGATQRLGGVAQAQTRPFPWLIAALSLTVVKATLLEPPPPTAQEPQPAFQKGQSLPFVPPVVGRADIGAQRVLYERLGPWRLSGKAGVGFSFLSARPLPYGLSADPVALLDASAGLDWGPLELAFEMFNLADDAYAALEYAFASSWNPDAPRSRVPTRHFSAGAPRSWLISLGLSL